MLGRGPPKVTGFPCDEQPSRIFCGDGMIGTAAGDGWRARAESCAPVRRRQRLIMWPGEAVERLLHRLRQRRVRVHVARQLERREVPLLRERQLGQQLRHVGADQVAAEQLEVLAVGDQLDEADRLAQAVGLAVRREGELGDLDLASWPASRACCSVGRRWRPAASRRWRAASCGSRERHGLGLADRLGGDDALGLGHVREHAASP